MILFLVCFSAGSSFLLSFLLFLHPLQQNQRANRWLGSFVFTLGLAFIAIYIRNAGLEKDELLLTLIVEALRFLSAPLLYLSIQFFIYPARVIKREDLLHFLPFTVYLLAEPWFGLNQRWQINDLPLSAYFLPVQTMVYTVFSYQSLTRHRSNVRMIASDIDGIDLGWLRGFLLILLLDFLLWVNEIFFNVQFLVSIDPFIYTGSICFLAYYSIRQKTIFGYKRNDLQEIAAVFEEAKQDELSRPKRLSREQLERLKIRLDSLLTGEKIYLDNELNFPQVARKLGTSIHDTSFLINEVTGDSFYNLINKYRVEEAKRLLASDTSANLNMLGIAFAAGFNSKTTFNTTFKKMTGLSPTAFAKSQKV